MWIAFFSQTGTEIVQLANAIGIAPDLIITNSPPPLTTTNPTLLQKFADRLVILPSRPIETDYFKVLDSGCCITLHGYLRIIPPKVCNQFTIFNGHPALVVRYPELKGRDQQKAVFIHKDKYSTIGTVIHIVTSELDSGKIILWNEASNTLTSLEEAYSTLRKMSLELWTQFFKRGMYNDY